MNKNEIFVYSKIQRRDSEHIKVLYKNPLYVIFKTITLFLFAHCKLKMSEKFVLYNAIFHY